MQATPSPRAAGDDELANVMCSPPLLEAEHDGVCGALTSAASDLGCSVSPKAACAASCMLASSCCCWARSCSDEEDRVYPGSTGIELLLSEDEGEEDGDSLHGGAGCLPLAAGTSARGLTALVLPSLQGGGQAAARSKPHQSLPLSGASSAGSDASLQPARTNGPPSPLSSSAASLSGASSMGNLSSMLGGDGSSGGGSQHDDADERDAIYERQVRENMALVADRLRSLSRNGRAQAQLAQLQQGGAAPPPPALDRPRRATAGLAPAVPGGSRPLAERLTGKKRGSAAAATCRVAPNPDGHACTACGATSTPVWRAGPFGPKTLCNACGVRYMKVAKRK